MVAWFVVPLDFLRRIFMLVETIVGLSQGSGDKSVVKVQTLFFSRLFSKVNFCCR